MYCPMTGRTINDLRNALNVPGRVTLVVHLTEGSHSYSDRNRTSLRIYYTPLLYPPLSDTEFAALLCSSETCEGPEGSQRAPYGGESRVRRFIVSSFKIFSCFATKACQVDMCSVNASRKRFFFLDKFHQFSYSNEDTKRRTKEVYSVDEKS
jgi:hypothetical protein